MWIVELGQIGRAGQPNTRTLSRDVSPSRRDAERIAEKLLVERGVQSDVAARMAKIADKWTDDFPTRTTVRIFEE